MVSRRVQESRIRDTGLWGGLFAIVALFLLMGAGPGAISDIPEFGTFIDEIASRHGFERDELAAVFAKARLQPAVLKAMSQPAEKKPWHFYREIFINDKRISDGAKFMHLNAETLLEARKAYGVPPEMTTAILGVETGYGKRTGRYLVLDTLATLAFNYPPRAKLFRHELEHYLLLIREEDIRPRSMKGSYAGAMGIAQFMPSSYRRYAVDFDGDGKRDLTRNVQDAIGSVGNYFKEHGWKADAPVAVRARITIDANRLWLERGSRIRRRVDEWIRARCGARRASCRTLASNSHRFGREERTGALVWISQLPRHHGVQPQYELCDGRISTQPRRRSPPPKEPHRCKLEPELKYSSTQVLKEEEFCPSSSASSRPGVRLRLLFSNS